MINILKDLWYKWRRAVVLKKVDALGIHRIYLKDKQLELKKKAALYLEKSKEAKRLSKQD